MRVILRRPASNEQTDRQAQRSRKYRHYVDGELVSFHCTKTGMETLTKSIFWLPYAVSFCHNSVRSINHYGVNLGCCDQAESLKDVCAHQNPVYNLNSLRKLRTNGI